MLVDLLHLSRNLRRSPASAVAAIVTLSLTLGAGVAAAVLAIGRRLRRSSGRRDAHQSDACATSRMTSGSGAGRFDRPARSRTPCAAAFRPRPPAADARP